MQKASLGSLFSYFFFLFLEGSVSLDLALNYPNPGGEILRNECLLKTPVVKRAARSNQPYISREPPVALRKRLPRVVGCHQIDRCSRRALHFCLSHGRQRT